MYLFILAAPGLSFDMRDLHCGMRDLVPRPGIEPGPPALEAQSLTRWTTREVPGTHSFRGQEPTVSPFAWQSNKAILFYFTQNSVSEI